MCKFTPTYLKFSSEKASEKVSQGQIFMEARQRRQVVDKKKPPVVHSL